MSELSSFFQNVKLPVISEVAHALIKTLDDEDASAKQISTIIARDPALTAKLMRLANSARFGVARGVNSLDDAISMAGLAHVRTLALAACFAETFPEQPGLDSDEFWKSSMACAGYAKWLAAGLGDDGQDAWLAGMMMRLGELLIYQSSPAAFAEIEQQPHLPGGRWEREKRLLGFSEGQITAELGRRWNFPVTIVQALEASSDPMTVRPFSKLGGIIHLASLLADTPSDDPAILETLPQDLVSTLQLDREWMHKKFPSHGSFSAAP
jgi:HD-like signal output (HDOD) protein